MTLDQVHALAATCPYQFPLPLSDDGLVALGGDLEPATLLNAYMQGLFPWFNQGEPIAWWCPNPRCVFVPNTFRPAKSLKRTAKNSRWQITMNQAFDDVVHSCSLPRSYSDDTWIHAEMKQAYAQLHQMGIAKSIEVWEGEPCKSALVGGLYGLQIGAIFFGESMFHVKTDASKIAFWVLTDLCDKSGIQLIDCQLENAYLMGLGASLMSRHDFLITLTQLVKVPCQFDDKQVVSVKCLCRKIDNHALNGYE